MDFKYLFTSLSGRINRAPYWQGNILLSVISVFMVIGIVMAIASSMETGTAIMLLGLILLGVLLFLASIPLAVKRLHDRGKSGHYAWIFYAAYLVGGAADPWTKSGEINPFGLIVSLITLAIGLWFFIELGFFRGTPGPNAYGPDPLEAK